MGTPCLIGIKLNNGDDSTKYRTIQVSLDGYRSYMAPLLLEHYNTTPKVKKLINRGHLRNVAPTPEESTSLYEDLDSISEEQSKPIEYRYISDLEFDTSANTYIVYIYIWCEDDEEWTCGTLRLDTKWFDWETLLSPKEYQEKYALIFRKALKTNSELHQEAVDYIFIPESSDVYTEVDENVENCQLKALKTLFQLCNSDINKMEELIEYYKNDLLD